MNKNCNYCSPVRPRQRKIQIVVLLLLFFCLSPLVSAPCGDVNSDGTIDIIDALMTAHYYLDLNPQPFDESAADVSGDGLITIVDALQIAQYYVEYIDSFKGCTGVTFVSFPDFFNFDIPEPWPKYDAAVDYFLNQVKNENPDFVLIDGDMVDGHWWDSPQCVEHMGTIYFSGFVRRMNKYGLKFYTAIGDHELGDDPWPASKRALVPHFEKVYTDVFDLPLNGPENKKELAYYVREGDLLLITVETFEIINDSMHIDVTGEQLEWLKATLTEHADAKFKMVQGHAGLWGELKSRSSSRLMFDKKEKSEFYAVLQEHNVDAYLVGEFHDVTVLEANGLWQIVHGSSWGREIVNTEDYLVAEISGNVLNLTLKRIYMDADGDYMWNVNKDPGPREIVRINERTLQNGPEITGTLTITNTDGEKVYSNQSGYFDL